MLSVIIVIYTYYKRKERIINSIESLRDLNSHLMYLSYILVAAISPLGRASRLHYVNVGKVKAQRTGQRYPISSWLVAAAACG